MKYSLCLSPGTWQYYFYDKETGEPLTPILFVGMFIMNENPIEIELPHELESNKNAVLKIIRTR